MEFKTSFLLSSTWRAQDVATFLGSMFGGLRGRVEVREVDDGAALEKLRGCEDVDGGRLFEVRFL